MKNAFWFVIVTFNSEITVENALNSIIECIRHPDRIKYEHNEIGICISDDGSTDQTIKIIDKFIDNLRLCQDLNFVKIIKNYNKINLGTVKNTLIAFEEIKKYSPNNISVYIKGLAGDDRLIPGVIWEAYNNCLIYDLDIQFNAVKVYKNNRFLCFKVSILDFLSRTSLGKIVLTKYHYVMTIGNLIKLDYGINLKKQAINYGLVLLDDWIDTVISISNIKCKYYFLNLPTVKYSITDGSVMNTKSTTVRARYQSDIIIQKVINSECELKILERSHLLSFIHKYFKWLYNLLIFIYRYFVASLIFLENKKIAIKYKDET